MCVSTRGSIYNYGLCTGIFFTMLYIIMYGGIKTTSNTASKYFRYYILLLIDTQQLAYRCHHAVLRPSTSKGHEATATSTSRNRTMAAVERFHVEQEFG